MVVLAFFPAISNAEKFVYLGAQPDGVEVHVQASPAVVDAAGRRGGWFRTMLPKAGAIKDESGATRQYSEMLAYNLADCGKRTMGAAAMIYYDDKSAVVARYEVPAKEIALRKVKANTLGDAMLGYLCATRKLPSPVVKSPGTDSPFK